MNVKPVLSILFLMAIVADCTGCARFATSDERIARLEGAVQVGMTLQQFKAQAPDAQLVQHDGNRKVFAVVRSQPCFICGTPKAFGRSFEVHATRFLFEDEALVSFARIPVRN